MELLLAAVVVAIFAAMLWPIFSGALERAACARLLSSMRQLQVTTQIMAMENSSDPQRSWPGDSGGSFSNWARQITDGYMSSKDLAKLLSDGAEKAPAGHPEANTNLVLVYAAQSISPNEMVFLTSQNFTNTASGGTSPVPGSGPLGTRKFCVFRKGGDGALLNALQAGQTNIIGGYAPLCH